MLITNHVCAGALAGRLCSRKPAAALLLGAVSHAAEDMTPHWGTGGTDLRSPEFLRVAVPDGLIGLAASAILIRAAAPRHRLAVIAGIAGACIPDADKPCNLFFGRSPFPAAFDRFHLRLQNESTHGLRGEVRWAASSFTAALIALRLFRGGRAQAARPRPADRAGGRARRRGVAPTRPARSGRTATA